MKPIYIIFALAALVLSSCSKDFLDTMPTSSVSETNILSSTENAMMAINGIHRMMHEGNSSGTTTTNYGMGGYPTFCLHLAMLSDDVVWTYDNIMYKFTAQWTHHHDLNHKYNDPNYYWKLFYRVINNANKVLEAYNQEGGLPGSIQTGYKVAGEAYALRGFSFFNLVQTWAKRYDAAGNNNQDGIIIKVTSAQEALPRSTVEECYQQILSDLDSSLIYLDKVTEAKVNKSHIDKFVVHGFKARVYLVMGKWQQAAEEAEYVINNSGAKLQADTYITKVNRHSDASNTEWLWALIAKPDGSQGGTLRAWHTFISNNNSSYNRNTPRAILNLLYDQIPESDVRKASWVPDPYTNPVELPNNKAARKAPWMSQKWIIDDNSTQNTYRDVAYMRLPEMYLIAAEGHARSGNDAKAQDHLYTLTHHRDPQYVKSTKTGAALADEVILQRRIELWAECGLRWHDLKRLDLPLDRGPKPREGYNQGGTSNGWGTSAKKAPWNDSKYLPLDPLASNYNMYGEQIIGENARYIGKPSQDVRWQWLLPNNEINANPNCTQNPMM